MNDINTSTPTPDMLYAHIQRRVARLLLRHDRRTFRGHFRELFRHSEQPQPEILRTYDDYVKLLSMADELFDSIIPRIRRQMSFQATRQTLDEEPPLRGQIDWPSSLARAWNECPDKPPTRFTTTLRHRSFDTPENKLLVAIVHIYAQALKRIRMGSDVRDIPLTEGEQRELIQLEDRVRRTLATTHFRALAHEAHTFDIPRLIGTVNQRLRPGRNAYRDLIGWWRRFEGLHIRHPSRRTGPPDAAVLDSEAHLSLLYQLWIALELVDVLDEHNALDEPTIATDRLCIVFHWQGRPFRLVYDRQPTPHLVWEGAPGERPDYFITRAEPLSVLHEGQTLWHEPGVLLDAKCYTSPGANQVAGAIKRMLADLQLADSVKGMLLLPDLPQGSRWLFPQTARYLGSVDPSAEVQLHSLNPMVSRATLHERMGAILDQVAEWLPERPAITCHGVVQDADSINAGGIAPRRCPQSDTVMALCPKPHISERRVDMVSTTHDCLKNPHICHILGVDIGRTAFAPFVQRVESQEQLAETAKQLRQQMQERLSADDDSAEAEAARAHLINTIGSLTEAYVQWRKPDTLHIEEKLELIFGARWKQTANNPHGLTDKVRHMLICGEYVRGELHASALQDWAACAAQYVRALEHEMGQRLYHVTGHPSKLEIWHFRKQKLIPMRSYQFTLGTPKAIYDGRSKKHKQNWETLLTHVVKPSNAAEEDFGNLIEDIDEIRKLRNHIAHGEAVDKSMAATARAAVLGEPHTGALGVLPRMVAMLNAPVSRKLS